MSIGDITRKELRIADFGLRICWRPAVLIVAVTTPLFGQDSPTPLESPPTTPVEQASLAPTATTAASPISTPTPASARSVKISFLPPPLEGTISLGIYDSSGKLVRVLHQEAELDEFAAGADALETKWDGRDDSGQDLPAGKYHARGFAVGEGLKVESGAIALTPEEANAAAVKIKLVANPLLNDARPVVELSIAFDAESCFLKTGDGLPLFTVVDKPNVTRAGLKKNSEKSVDLWFDDATGLQQLRISNVNKMMSFDCGDLVLK